MKLILNVVLVLVFLSGVLLDMVYRSVDLKELKRKARGTGDTKSARLYRMAAYGRSLEAFLWLVCGTSTAALIIMAADYAWWLALLAALGAFRLVWMVKSQRQVSGWAWSIASYLAPAVTGVVNLLHPLLKLIPMGHNAGGSKRRHTGIYEKTDLLEFINRQNQQVDNRVSEEDLRLAFGALTFGDKPVSKIMTPKSRVKFVAASDTIGPLLMDELHQSGMPSFPVVKGDVKSAGKEVVGVVYLNDLVEHPEGGRVRDTMKDNVFFINEQQTLHEALAAFLKTRTHLLIVVNNFEETVGVLTIEHVIEQLTGQRIDDGFEAYDNPHIVADIDTRKHHDKHSATEVVE